MAVRDCDFGVQDCSPKCLNFPNIVSFNMKDRINCHTISEFVRAGLGRDPEFGTILILDTPLLRTTKILFARFRGLIRRLIIVEIDSRKAAKMRNAVQNSALCDCPIDIYNSEVINYLRSSQEKIDFMWLDLQCDRFSVAHHIIHHLTNVQCFAVTIANRSRAHGSVASRVDTLSKSLLPAMLHKITDYGYKMGDGRAQMQLLIYSKFYSPCKYHIIRNTRGELQIVGYPPQSEQADEIIAPEPSIRRSVRILSNDPRSLRAYKRRVHF